MTNMIEGARLTLPVGPRDHLDGNEGAPVTLLEYGDYECPYCGMAHPIVKQIRREMGNRMRFGFRHFPLTRVHPHAQMAAEAAEAAGAQNRFWAMHDMLYQNQQALAPADLLRYAAALYLDVPRFRQDLASHRYLERVREDFTSGVYSGVNGTPTFFINEWRYDGSWDRASLLAALREVAASVR